MHYRIQSHLKLHQQCVLPVDTNTGANPQSHRHHDLHPKTDQNITCTLYQYAVGPDTQLKLILLCILPKRRCQCRPA